jgi:NitT/TauT family transport system permease protein
LKKTSQSTNAKVNDVVNGNRSPNKKDSGFKLVFGWLFQIASISLLILLWYILTFIVSSDVLPTPLMAIRSLIDAFGDGYIISDLCITFARIIGAFCLAMLIGICFGSVLGIPWIAKIFGFWVTLAASIPSLLYVVITYLAVGLNETAAIVAGGLIVAPSVTFSVWQGMKSLDPGLSEMARSFGVPSFMIFREVLLPQTTPFLFAAARQGLALAWKIMIFVEFMGRTSGVGYRIYYFYQLFDMKRVLASALLFVVIMLTVEFAILQNLEKYLFRWHRKEAR